jgi:hypothetical protein
MSDLLTLRECELASGIAARIWRKLVREGHVPSKRKGPLGQILVPVREVARVVASGYRPTRGKRRALVQAGGNHE